MMIQLLLAASAFAGAASFDSPTAEITVRYAAVLTVPETAGCDYDWHALPGGPIPGSQPTATIVIPPAGAVYVTCTKIHWESKQSRVYAILLDGQRPGPGPDPIPPSPIPPEPDPGPGPGPSELTAWVAKNVLETVKISQVDKLKTQLSAMAESFRENSKDVSEGLPSRQEQDIRAIIAGNEAEWEPWRNKLATKLGELDAAGKMTDPADRRQTWLDIAAGYEEASK